MLVSAHETFSRKDHILGHKSVGKAISCYEITNKLQKKRSYKWYKYGDAKQYVA